MLSLWIAAERGVRFSVIAACYVAGLAAWSLVEYVMHRFSFHHSPQTERQLAFGYLMHGVHHAYPDDSRRWVMPLVATLPIGVVLLTCACLAFGILGLPAFAGFMHGYFAYDTLHWTIHRNARGSRLVRYLRKYHLQHHYAAPDRHFGVSSPLWDVFFGTWR